ncbi:uncharacterized protein LOC131229589 [Magnolia sinica]|uniref:uncharacterized protein LOC131229589 n=1 Tax=Magnolia sinica TaxID=86752 RepID=UPI002659CF19|nr:uncharacterized protein LOC131229589 [Magnolia sinica]
MKTKTRSTSKLARCVRAPIRVLCRARDFYVKSMTDYAGRVHCGATTLPKSFSVGSSRRSDDEDLRTLMRIASQRSQRENEEKPVRATHTVASKGLPKSFSVGMGKIDEETPCDFEEDVKVDSAAVLYPRSRSYAVGNRRIGLQSL